MKIRLYYNEDNKPIIACALYDQIASENYEEICQGFLNHVEAWKIIDSLHSNATYPELDEDEFYEYKDKFVQEIIDNEYEEITLYIDDCDIVD